jgi:hypothetical protein
MAKVLHFYTAIKGETPEQCIYFAGRLAYNLDALFLNIDGKFYRVEAQGLYWAYL